MNCDKTKAPSKKSLVMTKSTTSFSISLEWTAYVVCKPPEGVRERKMTIFCHLHLNSLEEILYYFTEFASFGANYIKVVEDRSIVSPQKCSPKNPVFSNVWLMAIFTLAAENECINDRHWQWTATFFRPKLTYSAARFLCGSWATCFCFNIILTRIIFASVFLIIRRLCSILSHTVSGC